MPDQEAVLSEVPPLDAPHNISPKTPALDATPPECPLVESPVVPSLDNVTTQLIFYRPLHSQITIFREEEGERFQEASIWRASNSVQFTLWTLEWLLQDTCQTFYQVHVSRSP